MTGLRLVLLAVALGGCHTIFGHRPGEPVDARADSRGIDARPDSRRTDGRTRDAPTLATVDAASEAAVGSCPLSVCDYCNANTCYITSKCQTKCKCPTGMHCEVTCKGSPSTPCAGGIDCGGALSCKIVYGVTGSGGPACNPAVIQCGTGPCDVTCKGWTCNGGAIQCGGANPCTVRCQNAACAGATIKCGSGACRVSCSSTTGTGTKVYCGAATPCCVQNDPFSACAAEGCKCGPGSADRPCWCSGC